MLPMPQLTTPLMLATVTLLHLLWTLLFLYRVSIDNPVHHPYALTTVQYHVPAAVVVNRSLGTPMAQYASNTSIALEA